MARILPGLLLIALLPLAGCSAESVTPAAVSVAPAPGASKITLTRSRDPVAVAATAAVDVNGARFAELALGQSYSGDVRPGPVILTVTCWCGPGRYSVKLNAEPGKNYSFLVSPRGAQVAAQVAGGMIGLAMDTAYNGDNSGTFQITPQ
jgi:hypothetical protein